MIARRIAVVPIVLLAFAAPFALAAGPPAAVPTPQQATAAKSVPIFGKWKFTGKDKAGAVWTGTLAVGKLDADQFDPKKYVAQGDLRVETTEGTGKGANPPIAYDPATRVFTMGAESDYGGSVYTAVLSPDGKSLTKGAWRETERSSDEKEKRVVSEGEWSATRVEQ